VLGVLKGSSIKGQMLAAIVNKAKTVRSALRGQTVKEMANILTGRRPSVMIKTPPTKLRETAIPAIPFSGSVFGSRPPQQ